MLPNDKNLERRMEEAHQANLEGEHDEAGDSATPTPTPTRLHQTKKLTFANATLSEPASQTSSTYKEVLSQPARNLSHRQRMQWLQQRRAAGLWVQCDDCDKWRYMPTALDAYDLPSEWRCHMNPDQSFANCSVPEAPIRVRDEEDLIHGSYSCGSVVWARLAGWPWWPAMVDDEPDTEQFYWLDGFSDIPTFYNVTFFDDTEATRAWISTNQLKPYADNRGMVMRLAKDKKYKKRLGAAITQAEDALRLPHQNRLAKYSFVARYSGAINKPRKVSKVEVKKFTDRLKRKFNVDFSDESSYDSDESDEDFGVRKRSKRETPVRKNNRIPKGKVTKKTAVAVPKTTKASKKVEIKISENTEPNTEVSVNIAKTTEPKEAEAKNSKTSEPKEVAIKIQEIPLEKYNQEEIESNVVTHLNIDKNALEVLQQLNGDTMCSTNESFDNDTSDTYVPPVVNETQSTLPESQDTDRTIVETPKTCKDKDSFIPVRKLQDSMLDCSGTSGRSEQPEKIDDSEIFKQPSSMIVQVGSNATKEVVNGSFDNDTSKTYVPETETDDSETIEDIEACIQEDVRKIQEKCNSGASDDFDF